LDLSAARFLKLLNFSQRNLSLLTLLSLASFNPLYEFFILILFAWLLLTQIPVTNRQDVCVSWIQMIVLYNFDFQVLSLFFYLGLNLLTEYKTLWYFGGVGCGVKTLLCCLELWRSIFLHFSKDLHFCLLFFAWLAKLSGSLRLCLADWFGSCDSVANTVET
jgi:hypothetical protein